MTFEEAYEYLESNGFATTEELDLVSGIWGATVSVLDDVCYYRTGEYLPEEEEEDFED